MAAKSPVKEPNGPGAGPGAALEQGPALLKKPETASTPTATPRPLPPAPSAEVDSVHIPSYSGWFSWNGIHECEVRLLPEFFDGRSPSKNSRVYMYYRNSIIKQFRDNPPRKITFTDVRRTLVGDVGSIRRVFDFLEAWGLINYSASALAKPLKWDDKDSKSPADASLDSSAPIKDTAKRICGGCKSVCSIACFSCEKYDLTLCARCYVRGNYRVGVNSSEFKRVEISEETKADWTEKETLQLLEAIMHYGDDWKKVAQHVSGRSERDCISHFIKLPFGEEFVNHPDSGEVDEKFNQSKDPSDAVSGLGGLSTVSPCKRMRLTPLADASNPIMAQAAFLSALAGVDVAEAAAQAAVTALSEVDGRACKGGPTGTTKQQEVDVASNGATNQDEFAKACGDVNSMLEKEEQDVERAISEIVEVQMKEIQDKIVSFEELDLQMEKKRQQLEQIKNMLFVDQLNLLFHKSSAPKTGEKMEEIGRTDVS